MNVKKKILVADDNIEFCNNLSDILDIEGYEVLTSYDGAMALEMIENNYIDIALLDIKMPIMNGVDVFKKINTISPDTPVILMTAFSMENLIKDALRSGAFGCLRKPFDFNKLFNLIKAALPDGRLILVVDDDENYSINLLDILSENGYRVYAARDGETAIKKTKEKKFDIIILDMKLPTISGLETYQVIREIRPEVMIIAITGHIDEMDSMANEIVDKRAHTCLEKPLGMEKLLSIIEELI